MSGYREITISRGKRNLTERGLSQSSAKMLPKGTLLFSSRAPVGYVAIASNPVCTNQGFKSFILPDGFDSRFGYFYLRHIKPLAEARATGTTFKELSGGAASHLPFILAPLPEQKRIADKLEAVLGRVDACRARLARVPDLLKRFRQSVLAAATSDRLTEDWRQLNLVPSSENYRMFPLGRLVAEPLRNGKSVRDGDGVSVLRLTALRGGKFDWGASKKGDWTGIDPSRFFVEDGDFLIIRGNGSSDLVGRGCLAVSPPTEIAFPDTPIRVRPNEEQLVSRYLALIWDTAVVRTQIERSAKTTTGL